MNRHYEVDVTTVEARPVLKDRYLFEQHLKKDELVFAINYILKLVQLPVRLRKCVYLETSRWSLVRFIRAVCFEHIKYSLHTEEYTYSSAALRST